MNDENRKFYQVLPISLSVYAGRVVIYNKEGNFFWPHSGILFANSLYQTCREYEETLSTSLYSSSSTLGSTQQRMGRKGQKRRNMGKEIRRVKT